jgi:signal peptidase I
VLNATGGASRARPTPAPDPASSGHEPDPAALRVGDVLGALTTGLLCTAVLIVGFIAYGLLDNRWYHVVAVTGGSMSPTIEAGDLIVITRPPAVIRPGMVLTLEVDGAVVTHRVAAVKSDGAFVTIGDANTVHDDFSTNQVRVVGEYRFRIPVIGGLLSRIHEFTSGAFFATHTTLGVDAATGADAAAEAPSVGKSDGAGSTSREAAPVVTPKPIATPPPSPVASSEPSPEASEPAAPSPSPAASPTEGASPSPDPSAPSPSAPTPSADASPDPGASVDPEPSSDPEPSAPPASEPPDDGSPAPAPPSVAPSPGPSEPQP